MLVVGQRVGEVTERQRVLVALVVNSLHKGDLISRPEKYPDCLPCCYGRESVSLFGLIEGTSSSSFPHSSISRSSNTSITKNFHRVDKPV